jgi:SAM-dependent methyltransferase
MPLPDPVIAERARVAARYLAGSGIEIGALDAPTPLPPGASVRYVDLRPTKTLAEHYPELDAKSLVKVDVVDDGERLVRFADASIDFLVANHMLEHCENPLGTMRTHLRKVKPGGMLFYAMPDMRLGFDRGRSVTPFEHVVADDTDGGTASRWGHHLEWARFANAITDDGEVQRVAEENLRYAYSIHFHVWDASAWLEFLGRARGFLEHQFETRYFEFTGTEIISVLRRA